MPLTISDAEDAMLHGQAESEGWLREFIAEWYAPAAIALATGIIANLPVELQEQLRQMDKKSFDTVMKGVRKNG